MTNNILPRVRALVQTQMPDDLDITDDMPLFYSASSDRSDAARARGEAGLDSLDRVEIVMLLEDEFNIEITDAEMEGPKPLNTVSAIAAYLATREDAR